MMREAIEALQTEFTRRNLLKRTAQAAGIGLFWDRFGPSLFGQSTNTTSPQSVFSAIGNLVIPIDDDPGWATFEPGISDYGLNVIAKQVFLGGNQFLFQGLLGTLVAVNELPPLISFSTFPFLTMPNSLQAEYLASILSGQFENYGVQDILFLAAFVSLVSTKATFFSNYPNHLATPNAEYQVRAPSSVKTAWDIIGFRGPVGPDEEQQLRARFLDVPVLPGVDPNNPYI